MPSEDKDLTILCAEDAVEDSPRIDVLDDVASETRLCSTYVHSQHKTSQSQAVRKHLYSS